MEAFYEYEENYPEIFSQQKQKIQDMLGPVQIEHVGSTAVPGLGGKGIIDIMVGVCDIGKAKAKLQQIYEFVHERPERLLFRTQGVHLHLTKQRSREWKDTLAFRDHLLSNPDAVEEYVRIKKETQGDKELYRNRKKPFIEEILKNVPDIKTHIAQVQEKLTVSLPKDKDTHIGLPNPFIVPNNELFEHDQFYWDSYFIILGLIETGQIRLAKGIIDNFAYLCNRFGIIPSRNRYYNLGISQPPFFTSMVLDVFSHTKDKQWLREMAKTAEKELSYWMDDIHSVDGLSRYCDHWHTHLTAEHESGWDMTSRFDDRCLHILPVDLNSLLFKYEKDLSHIFAILEDDKATEYEHKAEQRKEKINKLMWDEFFFDYDFHNQKIHRFFSLAGFYPLWAGLATKDQAKRLRDCLSFFEYDGGLANTQEEDLASEFRQWDYPNGWPNQQWIVIKGLLDYGFNEDAERIAAKWLQLNETVFQKTGAMWEKYDVVNMDKGKDGRYPTQKGFGWTNAVYLKLLS
ncbi:MAG: trehalase family glycosidase [Candidatus Woesearchaeota archaeon]